MLNDAQREELGAWLVQEWIERRLEPRLLRDPKEAIARTKLRRDLAAAVSALGRHDRFEVEWGGTTINDVAAGRWCWIERWVLMSQDEDLLGDDQRRLGTCLQLTKAARDADLRRSPKRGRLANDLRFRRVEFHF